jgi:hypothetical protein
MSGGRTSMLQATQLNADGSGGAQVSLVLNFRMNDSSHVYNHESWAHSAELVLTILKARFGDSEQRSRRPEDLDG